MVEPRTRHTTTAYLVADIIFDAAAAVIARGKLPPTRRLQRCPGMRWAGEVWLFTLLTHLHAHPKPFKQRRHRRQSRALLPARGGMAVAEQRQASTTDITTRHKRHTTDSTAVAALC